MQAEVRIEITTESRDALLTALFGSYVSDSDRGDFVTVGDGANSKIRLDGGETLGFGLHESLEIVVSFAGGVACNLFSEWLLRKIEKHVVALRINDTTTPIDYDALSKALRKELEQVVRTSDSTQTE